METEVKLDSLTKAPPLQSGSFKNDLGCFKLVQEMKSLGVL